MSEYRVMQVGDAYQIQKKMYGKWEFVGEYDNLNAAKKMVRDLRKGDIHG
jgi:hypothetical protein